MFRLNRLDIRGHRVLGTVSLDFVKSNSNGPMPYISVIIGMNGIGKTMVLRAICEIFIYMAASSENKRDRVEPSFEFTISYTLNGRDVELSRKVIREITASDLKDLLPTRLVATSTYVLDKFPTKSTAMYRYCGIRSENTPGLISTKGLVRKTVEWILTSLDEKTGFKSEIRDLLGILGLMPRITLRYSMRHKDLFLAKDMTKELLIDIYTDQKKYFTRRKNDFWGTDAFHTLQDNPEKLDVIVAFLKRRAEDYGRLKTVEYELLDNRSTLQTDREALILLSKIGILSYPKLSFYKSSNNYDFSESSSGETTLLCQYLGIMGNIMDNSLILIDEPEQSSHPNWQINYIKWLKEIFRHYTSRHFIISTHSHFLLTDLSPDDSSLIVLDRDEDGEIEDRGDSITPFCWSTDDILYRIFKVRNTRNSVFESRMMHLYTLLDDRNGNSDEINSLVTELEEYRLNQDDPLMKLIEIARGND